ncbi:PE family protein [Mycobacterium heidelbergense]|uniref:Uncharacterized protein n=1 Tax=Mycobacterium heidelbergense TaxID=53376 RepID=A0A1X0DVT7_MYCHE|nr:PE family protein [Mycobacterium heidelbergense]MCV7050057.1 PE family protein [Mycobacterium heidelbergense]ORA76544.1 hypothetical protein BST25_00195 [Mycobacterium heidelbergense]BBZ51761.1 hypothetical protein MHEI_34780 [Mycobacterium heidelbergense]
MSLTVTPAALASAGQGVHAIGRTLGEANAQANAPTSTMVPAAADQVSAGIATIFNGYGAIWQDIAAQAAAWQAQFAQLLGAAEFAYVNVEYAATHLMDFNDPWIELIEFI